MTIPKTSKKTKIDKNLNFAKKWMPHNAIALCISALWHLSS